MKIGAEMAVANGTDKRKLTPKQQMFVMEYLVDLNATQAAIRSGYSAKTANEQGARLLANVSVQAALKEAMDERASRVELTADSVLRELRDLVFHNPKNYYDKNGQLLAVKDMPDEVAKTVHSVKILKTEFNASAEGGDVDFEPVQTVEVKGIDKLKAIEMSMKHLGILTERIDVGVTVNDVLSAFPAEIQTKIKEAISKKIG